MEGSEALGIGKHHRGEVEARIVVVEPAVLGDELHCHHAARGGFGEGDEEEFAHVAFAAGGLAGSRACYVAGVDLRAVKLHAVALQQQAAHRFVILFEDEALGVGVDAVEIHIHILGAVAEALEPYFLDVVFLAHTYITSDTP